jgi:hypothetical protein
MIIAWLRPRMLQSGQARAVHVYRSELVSSPVRPMIFVMSAVVVEYVGRPFASVVLMYVRVGMVQLGRAGGVLWLSCPSSFRYVTVLSRSCRLNTPTPCRSSGGGCHRAYLVQEGDSFRESLKRSIGQFRSLWPVSRGGVFGVVSHVGSRTVVHPVVPKGPYRTRRGFLIR